MRFYAILTAFLLFAGFERSYAKYDSPREFALVVGAEIDTLETPAINLAWAADDSAYEYAVFRKHKSENRWDALGYLPGDASGYRDEDVRPRIDYEYKIQKVTENYDIFGYVYAGWELPPVEDRGKALLLIDSTISAPLADEIAQFKSDLAGDGYFVVERLVPRAETFDREKVEFVKNIIKSEYLLDSFSLNTAIFLGRVPVPYSGDYTIDGHRPEHEGAWPADAYYADVDGNWTDTAKACVVAMSERQHNYPGDGKFDNWHIPTPVEFETGRIDLFNLPDYSLNEIDLIRKYLRKNHKYRHKKITARDKALIDDKFGMSSEEAFAAAAWINFPAVVGLENVVEDDFMPSLETESYIWAYGCNSGSPVGAHQVAYSSVFAARRHNAIFVGLLGSWFGDWDVQRNLMRSAIASEPSILACVWNGRPFWHFHHMALGSTIGYAAKLAQNNGGLYESSAKWGYRGVHVALMGDPTLKMRVVAPPLRLKTKFVESELDTADKVELTWLAPEDDILGYRVYRAESVDSAFVRISGELVESENFVDKAPLPGENVYMVRALKLEQARSGSFYNLSQGVFRRVFVR